MKRYRLLMRASFLKRDQLGAPLKNPSEGKRSMSVLLFSPLVSRCFFLTALDLLKKDFNLNVMLLYRCK